MSEFTGTPNETGTNYITIVMISYVASEAISPAGTKRTQQIHGHIE